MLWFSNHCDDECSQAIIQELGARTSDEREMYLGVFITHGHVNQDLTHTLLLQKMRDRLAGWKLNMLSNAGRVVLIKYVLASLPVYFMTIGKISARTMKEITSLMWRFLWGMKEGKKCFALIVWHKLYQTAEEGGLGVKYLKLFNEALLLKLVWQVAGNKDKLWIEVLRAKNKVGAGYNYQSICREIRSLLAANPLHAALCIRCSFSVHEEFQDW